jgi:HAE1 family hydrophobic/amphiphilic exporter-1
MIAFSVRRPVTIMMIVLGLFVLGIISLSKIPVQLMPNFVTPEFSIIINYKGATSEEVESDISTPLEKALSTLSGLKKIESLSTTERSEVKLNFRSDINYLETISFIRDKLDGVGLPEYASRPKIIRVSSSNLPLLRIVIKSKSTNDLFFTGSKIKEELLRKIESTSGVALTNLYGVPTKEIAIKINPEVMLQMGIEMSQIPSSIASINQTIPAGMMNYQGKQTPIKMGHKITNIKEIEKITLKSDGAKSVQLGQIGSVGIVEKESRITGFYNNEKSIILEVKKEADANSVKVATEVKEVIKRYISQNPDLELNYLIDQGSEIQNAIDNVLDSIYGGGILSIVVILLFMQSFKSTGIVALAIPISLVITIMMMYFSGVTFNLMSLAGLALGVGMLMDNSVVVLETIEEYKIKLNDLKLASIVGTEKVVSAITASTLTSMAVFAPLVTIEGIIGQMFRDVALTVCYSLFSSLIVAITIVPMLASIEKKTSKTSKAKGVNLAQFFFNEFNEKLVNRNVLEKYKFKIKFVIFILRNMMISFLLKIKKYLISFATYVNNKYIQSVFVEINRFVKYFEKTIESKIISLFGNSKKFFQLVIVLFVLSLVIFSYKGAELVGGDSSSHLNYVLEFAPGINSQNITSKVKDVTDKLKKIKFVKNVSSIIGDKGDNFASLIVEVDDSDNVDVVAIGKIIKSIPETEYRKIESGFSGDQKPLTVELYSENLNLLQDESKKIITMLKELNWLKDIESDMRPQINQYTIDLNKTKTENFGIDPVEFLSNLKNFNVGLNAPSVLIDNVDYPVTISSYDGFLSSVDKLKYFSIPFKNKSFFLDQISQLGFNKSLGLIRHNDKKRVVSISANLVDVDLKTASKDVLRLINSKLSKEIILKLGGQSAEREKSEKSLIITVLFSIFLIYLLLASQFENLLQPAIILVAVPLSIIGVAFILFLLNLNISSMVFVGFIILGGISVNTSIVMVDAINQHIDEGMEITEAIITGSLDRIRPIIMTTVANVIGLIPMILASGQGAAMRKPLAYTILGGLISSTILTIFIIPLIYYFMIKNKKDSYES